MATVVTLAPPEVAANLAPDEVEERVTVSAVVVTLPNASCSCTVSGPSVALADAGPDTAVEVMTSLAGAPTVIVSDWVALVKDPEVVTRGAPDLVSP